MICKKCGKEMEGTFCPYCGTKNVNPVSGENAMGKESTLDMQKVLKDQSQKLEENEHVNRKSSKPSLKMMILLVAVVVVAVSGIVFFVTRPKVFNVSDYITTNIEGYDGYGYCNVEMDSDKFCDDVISYLKKKGKLSIADEWRISEELDEVTYTRSKDVNLKNGDKVKIEIHYDNEIFKHYGIKLEDDKEEIKVSGLEKPVITDVFKGVSLEFTGTAPYLQTNDFVTYTTEDGYEITCWVEPNRNLTVGDEVTLTYRSDLPEGVFAEKETTTVIVPEADRYILDVTELSKEELKQIADECSSIAEESITGKSVNGPMLYLDDSEITATYEVQNIKLSNDAIFQSKNEKDFIITPNSLWIFLEADIMPGEYSDRAGETIHVYGAVEANKIIKLKDGTLQFETDNGVFHNVFDLYERKEELDEELRENELYSDMEHYSVKMDKSSEPVKLD